MRRLMRVMAVVAGLVVMQPSFARAQQEPPIFPKGELSTAKNHSGDIWLNELSVGDAGFDASVAQAVYGAGARLDWHVHPGGQVLLITEGTGFYQERGRPVRVVHKGDVIRCAAGVEHWHGAAPDATFAYVAVTPTQKGKTIWLKPVTEAEYRASAAR